MWESVAKRRRFFIPFRIIGSPKLEYKIKLPSLLLIFFSNFEK